MPEKIKAKRNYTTAGKKRMLDGIKRSWKNPEQRKKRLESIAMARQEKKRLKHNMVIEIACSKCGTIVGIARRETRIICTSCVQDHRSALLKTEFDTP